MTESERTADEHLAEADPRTRPGRLGLSPNLWRVAAVIAIAQFSTSLWNGSLVSSWRKLSFLSLGN